MREQRARESVRVFSLRVDEMQMVSLSGSRDVSICNRTEMRKKVYVVLVTDLGDRGGGAVQSFSDDPRA